LTATVVIFSGRLHTRGLKIPCGACQGHPFTVDHKPALQLSPIEEIRRQLSPLV